MLPSSSLQPPQFDRPASVLPNTANNNNNVAQYNRRQQRASHTVVSPQHPSQPREDQQAPYTDVYSHPAAMAYAAAHPRRTIPKFGPYLLLQTLGEGEFGKVKLGLHCQWGEEVAVKLIRRGNIDNSVRMSKVEREIEVLRTLKHPNIVRLYDVIETDKYIGIILEYASGGELFDHILAHRYLRERDAAKLFSQLISGVWYIHQKKIVHRDLKLENLLLDRHRNVIITDFGFANRFEHRSDDLMQTSCGSPCYAAPELVISEGLYVGSAVDIWSCGVILYAMLAGYLPFDDDPANPDGDNINLLYKYIVNTPLSFPDYISPEARDILSMMLVPDPTRRSSLEEIMRHPWLAAYATPKDGIAAPTGVSNAFGKSVEQLERAAMEQHQQKRLAYQRQMKAAALASQQPAPSAPIVARSQSHYIGPGNGHRATATEPGGRSHSAQPEYLYDSSVDLPASVSTPAAGPSSSAKRTASHGTPRPSVDDDPFGPPPSASAAKAQLLNVEAPKPKAGGDFRHTIQVEYDEPKGQRSSRRSEDVKGKSPASAGHAPTQSQTHVANGSSPSPKAPGKERRPSAGSIDVPTNKPLPPSPLVSATTPSPSVVSSPTSNTLVPPTSTSIPASSTAPKNKTRQQKTPMPNISVEAASPPGSPIKFAPPPASSSGEEDTTKPVNKGHKKGRPSLDKIGLPKIFGGTNASASANGSVSTANGNSAKSAGSGSVRVPSEASVAASGTSGKSTSSVVLSPSEDKEVKVKDKDKDGKKTTRRNTLTVMVEPFRMRSRAPKTGRTASSSGEPVSAVSPMSKDALPAFKSLPTSAVAPVMASASTSEAKTADGANALPAFSGTDGNGNGDLGEGRRLNGISASTSKARKVMQWFRAKSKVREMSVDDDEKKTKVVGGGSGGGDVEYPKAQSVSTTNLASTQTVKLVGVLPQRTPSVATTVMTPDTTAATPSLVTRFRNSVTIGNASHSSTGSKATAANAAAAAAAAAATTTAVAHPWGALRTHHGAVDQSMVTTKPPPEVFKHVREVLEGMGVEIYVESEYKFRCVRAKRRKGSIAVGTSGATANSPLGASSVPGIAAITLVGSAASNGVDKRGLPVPSPSTFSAPGGMLRGLLMRRQSSQVSSHGVVSPTLGPFDDEPMSPDMGVTHETTYGDPSQDAGDEIKFSVELTRIDRLNDTFSLDIRRLKGNLRSYKFLYDTFRERAVLQR